MSGFAPNPQPNYGNNSGGSANTGSLQPPPQQGYGHYYGQQQQAPPPQQQQQQYYGNGYQHQHHHHHHHHHQQQQGPFGFSLPQAPRPDPEAQKKEDELRSWFAAVDQKGTGKIDAESLRAALSSSDSEMKASTAERLIKMFDKDSTGAIEFNEFKAAHKFIGQMADGFRQRDADGSGLLEANEVREALALSGYHLSGPAFDLLMKKFGKARSGGVLSLDFGSYIDLSILLGSTARVYGFYDRNRSGLVTFDFNTFFVALLAATQ